MRLNWHTTSKTSPSWTGEQYLKCLYTEADLVLQNFFPKLLYLLLISNESANTSVGYYSSRPIFYFFILRTHLSSPTPAHCSLWNTVQKYSSTQKYSNFFLWKRLSLALPLIKLYYMGCRSRWIKKYSHKGNYDSLTEKVRMHSDLQRLEVAEEVINTVLHRNNTQVIQAQP